MTNAIASLILVASWQRFSDTGKLAANGHPFCPMAMSAASWDFPLGSIVRVEEVNNHSVVVVKITDRPARRFAGKRIDLSPRAFAELDGLALGICPVSARILNK